MITQNVAATTEPTQTSAPVPRAAFRKRRKIPIKTIVIVLVALSAGGFWAQRKFAPKPVVTVRVVRGTAVEAVYATGSVEAQERVVVKAKVGGSLAEIRVREGSLVKKGDLLIRVDAPSLKFELVKGQADLWAAKAQSGSSAPQLAVIAAQIRMTESELTQVKSDQERLERLVLAGAATDSDLDKLKTRRRTLEAQIASQRSQWAGLNIDLSARAKGGEAIVDSLESRLSDAEVRAPMDGVVLSKNVDIGEVVMVNQVLLKLGDTSNLVLECPIDEADIAKITVGKKAAVSLYAFGSRAFEGEVIEILPDADRAKKSFLTKVKLLNPPPGLRSGMSAEVNIVVDEHNKVLLAPSEGVGASGDVFVVQNGRLEKRTVKMGVRDMLKVEILSGLEDGDEVVVVGSEGLEPGTKVKPTTREPATTPSSSAKKSTL